MQLLVICRPLYEFVLKNTVCAAAASALPSIEFPLSTMSVLARWNHMACDLKFTILRFSSCSVVVARVWFTAPAVPPGLPFPWSIVKPSTTIPLPPGIVSAAVVGTAARITDSAPVRPHAATPACAPFRITALESVTFSPYVPASQTIVLPLDVVGSLIAAWIVG